MSTRKAKIVVMMALSGAALAVACGGGSAPVNDVGSPYDEQGGAASSAFSDQDPSPARTAAAGPQATTNPQGTSGNTSGGTSGNTSGGTSGNTSGGTSGNTSGGTSGMPANCPPCDGAFTCDVTVTSSATTKSPVTLVTKNGACVFSSQSGDVVFACGGALTQNGANVGTWANCVKTPTGGAPTPPPDAG
jgi:hypothetical protein